MPVWPTWLLCGYQPASTAAREAPTAAPRLSANASTGAKSPAGAAAAGDDDRGLGELGAAGGLLRLGLGDPGRLGGVADRRRELLDRAARAGAASMAAEFGLTVMIGVPLVTVDVTV